MSIIDIKSLSLWVGNKSVFEDLSLEIEEGEAILITGLSGSGKTSLFRVLTGSIPRIFSGAVKISSTPDIEALRRRIFYMPQEPWFGLFTPYVWSEIRSNPGAERIDVDELISYLGLEALLNRSTYTLSAGETQRLLFLNALLSARDLILLDEPTSYLDTGNATRMLDLVDRLRREFNLTFVIADHRIDLWRDHVDKIYVLENKRLRDLRESDYLERFNEYNKRLRDLREDLEKIYRDADCINFYVESYRYPGSRRDTLRNISGEICLRGVIAVKGVSGSGKSTLLRILLERIIDNRYSEVIRLEIDNSRLEYLKRNTILLPDNPFLFFTEPIVREELRGSIDSLERLGLSIDRADVSIKRLSSGERRRVALLSALGRGKKIIFIDEPTVGLDPYHKYLYLKHLTEYLKQDYGFFISSHDPSVEVISSSVIEIH